MLAIIGAVISDIGRLIGIGGVLFIGLLLYKEDIPGANRIPFLPSIPILGDLTAGPVHTHAAQQVKLATDDLVTKFERDTLAWQLGEERRRATEAALITEEYRKRADAALRLKAERGGSVCLNSSGRFGKWISASIMPPPSLVTAR